MWGRENERAGERWRVIAGGRERAGERDSGSEAEWKRDRVEERQSGRKGERARERAGKRGG